MRNLLQDLRFAVRQLRKSPGFALTTVLTLALGIGATTAMFSLINGVLLRPLPFPDPDRLMTIAPLDQSLVKPGIPSNLSYPDFFDWRSRQHSFEAIASYRRDSHTLTGSGTPQQLESEIVSSEFFRVLGVNPVLGRGFIPDDEKKGTRVVVLSHELWLSTFGGDPNILGHNITLEGNSYTVIGVMPAGFAFPMVKPRPELWNSLAYDDDDSKDPVTKQRGYKALSAIGRLKPGVTVAQATADLSLIAQNLAAQYPDEDKKLSSATVVPELENLVGDTRSALRVLFAAVTFLLLIACTNVAGLMLTRTSRRRSELAVRSALGATRFEIIRQILVYFPGENPLGKHIKPGLSDDYTQEKMREIIGVVGSVKRKGLTADTAAQFYLPLKQAIFLSPPVVIRTAGDPVNMVGPLRTVLAQLDPNVPLYRISTVDDYISLSAAQPRFQTVLITFFAVMALLLAAVGLYAVLSYMVAQRTLEIGLRLALGAQRESVVGLILGRGLTLAAIGLAIGVAASLVLTRFMSGMLYGVHPLDPLTFVAVGAVLMLVSLIASSAPAYRAARLDPMKTLREQ